MCVTRVVTTCRERRRQASGCMAWNRGSRDPGPGSLGAAMGLSLPGALPPAVPRDQVWLELRVKGRSTEAVLSCHRSKQEQAALQADTKSVNL